MSVTKEQFNFFKIVILLIEYGTKVLREKLKNELSKCHRQFQEWLKASCHELIHLHKLDQCCKCTSSPTRRKELINKKQLILLFVEDRGQTCTRPNKNKDRFCCCSFKVNTGITEEDMDITLLSCFLINIVKLNVSDRKLVEELRDKRNGLSHVNSTTIPTEEFEKTFQDITHIINEVAKGFDTELFETLRSQMIKLESLPQPVSSTTELGVTCSEDAQTNTEPISDTKATSLQVQDYLRHLSWEDLQGLPEQILKQLTEQVVGSSQSCFQSAKEMTRLALDQHVSPENVFHPTQQLQDSFHILYTKHVLLLYGIAGSGKTTLSYEIMLHMRHDLTPVILSNPDQVKSIRPNDEVLVFLDDILGRSAYSQDNALIWYPVFHHMYILSRQGSPRFIMAFRENVYEDFRNDIDAFDNMLFCQEHLVNVTRMTLVEKEELLGKYCNEKGVAIYYGKGCAAATESPKSLDKSTFNQICNTETLTGFPQSCFLFFSNDVFFQMGQDFFKHPDQSLIAKVDRLRKSKDERFRLQYAVLAHMMLTDGDINLQTLAESADFKQVTNEFDLKAITCSKLRDCIEEDNVRSLLLLNKDEIVFRHQTVKEAVFLSFSNHFPDKIFLKCKLQLIQDFLRSRSYDPKRGETAVILQDRCFTTFSSRIIDEILQNNNYYQCVRLQVFEDSSFTKMFVSALLIALRDRDDSSEVVKKLLLYSSEHGNNDLLSELLHVCVICDDNCYPDTTKEVNISMTYFREEILSTAIRKGQVKAITIILKKERKVLYRSKCGLLPIHTAIWTGIRPVCDILWDEYDKETICMPSFNDTSGRRCIHYCAMRGYIDKIREIKSQGDEFVMAVDARSQSALHYAAYGGQYQIFHELLGYGLSIADRTIEKHSVLQVLLISLDYDERCNILPQIPQNISKAISGDSVLWNSDYYRALEYILEIPGTDLNDLDVIIHKTHNYNVAHYACIDNADSVVSLLLNKRRDLFTKRNGTRLPMVWDIAAFLGRFSILKTLFRCGLIHDTDRSSLARKAKQGRKQARAINLKDRRLLLNRHEREKIWPDSSFPFVIFGQEYDYDEIEKFLKQ